MYICPYLFCLSFYLLYFVLLPFEDNGLPFWVPGVLCQRSEFVLWNFLRIQMFFQWICGGESDLPILFYCHLRTAPLLTYFAFILDPLWSWLLSPDQGLLVSQLCETLCDSMDHSPPGSPVCGIIQARILKLVAISFSMGSSWPRDWTRISWIAGRFFTIWATREAQMKVYLSYTPS